MRSEVSEAIPVVTTERKPPTLDVVDAQFHLRGAPEAAIAAMDAVGVESAVVDIIPPETRALSNGAVRYDYGLAESAMEQFPGRFAYMARFDPRDPDIDSVMERVTRAPGAVVVRTTDRGRLMSGGDARMLAAATKHHVPVMIYAQGCHDAVMRYVREFDELQFVIDHCGLFVQEFFLAGSFPHTAAFYIDALMEYARFPHVAVKWSHAPRMSRQPYPFHDVREQLTRVVERFGVNRVMWGSDYTVARDHHTYAESLFSVRESDRLSTTEKEWILGKTLRTVLNWPRTEST